MASAHDPDATILSVASTAYSRVTEMIHRDIVNGRLAPQLRLKVGDLAKRYGVSPSPIREALQQLQAEGLVVLLPNRGAVVRGIDGREFVHMMHVRAAIEGVQARICAQVADAKLLGAISAAAEGFRKATEAGDREGWFDWNRRFHRSINGADGSVIALETVERVNSVMSGFRRTWAPDAARRRRAADEHDQILDAIRRRDESGAERAARDHVLNSLQDIIDRMREEGAWEGGVPASVSLAPPDRGEGGRR